MLFSSFILWLNVVVMSVKWLSHWWMVDALLRTGFCAQLWTRMLTSGFCLVFSFSKKVLQKSKLSRLGFWMFRNLVTAVWAFLLVYVFRREQRRPRPPRCLSTSPPAALRTGGERRDTRRCVSTALPRWNERSSGRPFQTEATGTQRGPAASVRPMICTDLKK